MKGKGIVFIRNLIDVTANNLGDKEKYGYGLIDCEAAISNYKDAKDVLTVEEMNVEENESPILCSTKDELEALVKKWEEEEEIILP